MNKKKYVFEICFYVAVLIVLLLYAAFGKNHQKPENHSETEIPTPPVIERVQ